MERKPGNSVPSGLFGLPDFWFSYGTKNTYRSSINAFNRIYAIMGIDTPFRRQKAYLIEQDVKIFLALATIASYKAAVTCRMGKSAAEDAWLLHGIRDL